VIDRKELPNPGEEKRIFPDELKELIDASSEGTYTLLDVRQPFEYEEEHLPGAKLLPLPRLPDSLAELDPLKTFVTYCHLGGRSRMAAKLLAHRGFGSVYYLEGGIEGWEGKTAVGPVAFHLKFIRGDETPDEAIRLAYRMEEGLKRFHETVRGRTHDAGLRGLLDRLAMAEESHKQALLALMSSPDEKEKLLRETSEAEPPSVMEGGIGIEEFMERNAPFFESLPAYIELAMGIETQALDLYLRMADTSAHEGTRKSLLRIADEEKAHMAYLGAFLEDKEGGVQEHVSPG
jgi:sulfur-carrier protein adenylyltransferase/sulfurtransferase